MTVVDVVIVILAVGAGVRGVEEGFVRQSCSTIGFFAGLFLGAWLQPHLPAIGYTAVARFVLTIFVTFGLAFVGLFLGEVVGILAKRKLTVAQPLNRADNILGSALAVISFVVLIWLSAATLVRLPYPAVQNTVRDSSVIALLDQHLPPTPSLVADLGHWIAPNGFPSVFVGTEPAPPHTTASQPTPADLAAAVQKDQASVLKVQGQGCGGIVTGSGFVVATDLVATNAHVVAGIHRPYVIDQYGSHAATTVWFDADLDFAVLRVDNLRETPLHYVSTTEVAGTPGGILGYPEGGNFAAGGATINEEFIAKGSNIYNQGTTYRDVYSIHATVVHGNSGGPLVNLNGDVIGVVFATSPTYNNLGYALTMQKVSGEIGQAKAATAAVSTGACAE